MRYIVIAAMFSLAGPAVSQTTEKQRPCSCINRDGEKVPLGQYACLRVGGKEFTARCSVSLNLLTWRKVSEGCLHASLMPQIGPQISPKRN